MKIGTNYFEPKWLLTVSFFLAGAFLGILATYLYLNVQQISSYKIHSANSNFKYINPLLAVDFSQEPQFSINTSMQLQIQGLIDSAQRNQTISSASMYFRDIEPGLWVGINENEKFSPGKLLKIPLMISYYKLAENDSTILSQELVFNGPYTVKDPLAVSTSEQLEIGKSYSVDELINAMILNSDNDAANLLFDNIDKTSLNEIFSDLGIDFKEDKTTPDFISLKLYSLFLRVLYNATYLNREYSEKALKLLDESNTNFGLSAGLPKDLAISNRYGSRKYTINSSTLYEMYDCGIVYYPDHPYILCGFSRGGNLDKLNEFMRNLGDLVYREVDYKYKNQ